MNHSMPALWVHIKKHRYSIISVAAVLLVLLLIHLVMLAPLRAEKDTLESHHTQQKELAERYGERLKQAGNIRENLQRRQDELTVMQKRLFRGNDPYQLAASMGDQLSKGGEQHALEVKTYQVLASKEYGLYQEVHLRFNLQADVRGLHHFLQTIHEMETAMVVQEINIQKIQRRAGPDLVVNVILAALMEINGRS